MKRRPFIALISFAAALACISSAHADDLYGTIMARKSIRVAVPTDYPPYGSVSTDMQPRGLDIDMATLIGKKLGVKVELIPVTAPNRIAYLQTNKADITISSLGKTAERAKVVDFSIAYAPFFDAVFGTKKVKITGFEDLKGKTISVTRGSMQDQELEQMAPGANVKRFEDNNATLSAFLAGQTQMFATGTTVAAALQKMNPALDMELKVILANAPCYIAMPKGESTLLAKINMIVREARTDGTIDKLSQTWLGAPAGTLPE
ncbi:transporter substrate-binding domain-containing protein [Herbaspirillum sp. alder98]|uniref:transporter substrate-binding domain-containing protein n=1 Tax=Herbaspirillum sp. alder98 TaxID=2913096 RepID=UPI001CD894EE|nr:transporter substrate-binding domain-containing protein [Herbaspirillum sp. alder98]MCA1323205.1 transporter substrate-binding domain-containing protein [Herbaspirillum sp. alder98]